MPRIGGIQRIVVICMIYNRWLIYGLVVKTFFQVHVTLYIVVGGGC